MVQSGVGTCCRARDRGSLERLCRYICGVCGGTVRVIACIETPELIEKILTHLAARNTDCIDRTRAPPLHPPQAQPPASPSPALS